ncbi:hypothetical protein GCM10008018_09360 [Paenibacillus marchantiophytorum]|uniref:Uncharacterized protein n=1 Tax=Paenibacillus marchantiophytorum TaxID=1619310 RepID=A0ABQ2BSP6_9BACL|nr:hypothetical protein [Paenibacillus marchantiophytorum]GGI44891.1 hypothetical protein GCM10008018_09360 [Paenibacillus marchantiophytorum]
MKAPIAIQDRIWLGSGHGWAGANYVTWNTEGDLTLQPPPTAQNYAVGHVGERMKGRAPNEHWRTDSTGKRKCGGSNAYNEINSQPLMNR